MLLRQKYCVIAHPSPPREIIYLHKRFPSDRNNSRSRWWSCGLALILASLLFILRRRRLAENSTVNTRPDPHLGVALSAHDEKQSPSALPPPSKRALDHELRTAHAQLQALRHELARPGFDSEGDSRMGTDGTDSRVENAELRARIGMLTEEVERLRSMGAEAPPAYSMQDGQEDGDVHQ
ncbi:hypothetical protein DFH06DRAFT_1137068 [Mycena polygramma]|nr:hypothetical protein DFH06DRAFT_1137068 [Mycena polygramma]